MRYLSETHISIKAAVVATISGLFTNIVDIVWLLGDVTHNGFVAYHGVIGVGFGITVPVLGWSMYLLYRANQRFHEEMDRKESETQVEPKDVFVFPRTSYPWAHDHEYEEYVRTQPKDYSDGTYD